MSAAKHDAGEVARILLEKEADTELTMVKNDLWSAENNSPLFFLD